MRFLLFDKDDKYKGELKEVISGVNPEELFRENILNISFYENTKKGDRILVDIYGKFKEFIVSGVVEESQNKEIVYNVYAEDSWNETLNDYIEGLQFENRRLKDVVPTVLEKSRWEVGIIENPNDIGSVYLFHTYVNTAFHDIMLVWDMEIEPVIQYVPSSRSIRRILNVVKKRGSDKGRRISYSDEIVSAKRETLRDDIVTAIYAYGAAQETESAKVQIGQSYYRKKGDPVGVSGASPIATMTKRVDISSVNGGKKYVENVEALHLYGKLKNNRTRMHSYKVMIYDKIKDPEELKQAALKDLEILSKPRYSYEITLSDLAKTEGKQFLIELGDDVIVKDETFNPPIDIKTRVLRIERDLVNEENTIITLGEVIKDFSDLQADNRIIEVQDGLISDEDFDIDYDDGSGWSGGETGGGVNPADTEYIPYDRFLKEVPSLESAILNWVDVNDKDSVVMNAGGDVVMLKDTRTGETIFTQELFERRPSVSIINNRRWISFNAEPITRKTWRKNPIRDTSNPQKGEYLEYLNYKESVKTAIFVYINRTPKDYSITSGIDYLAGYGYPFLAGHSTYLTDIDDSDWIYRKATPTQKLVNRHKVEALIAAPAGDGDMRNTYGFGSGLVRYVGMNKFKYETERGMSRDPYPYNAIYGNANCFFSGEIAEIIFLKRELLTQEADKIEEYVRKKYGAFTILDGRIQKTDWRPSYGQAIHPQ